MGLNGINERMIVPCSLQPLLPNSAL